MFDSTFKVDFHGCNDDTFDKHHIKRCTYAFTSRRNRQRYIVTVDDFLNELHVVKFYLKSHEKSKNKFMLLTHEGYSISVFSTVLSIMKSIYDRYPYCSFIFQGERLLKESDHKDTKRHQLYSKIAKYYFSPEIFEHLDNRNQSYYLLLNRQYHDRLNVLKMISTTISESR